MKVVVVSLVLVKMEEEEEKEDGWDIVELSLGLLCVEFL